MAGMTVHKLRDAVMVMAAIPRADLGAPGVQLGGRVPAGRASSASCRALSRLPDIFTAPFLHSHWQHIEGN